jgi:hypothetical protein
MIINYESRIISYNACIIITDNNQLVGGSGPNNKLKKSNLPQQTIVEGMAVELFNEVESLCESRKVSLIPWGFARRRWGRLASASHLRLMKNLEIENIVYKKQQAGALARFGYQQPTVSFPPILPVL